MDKAFNLTAKELIEKIFEMDDTVCKDAAKNVSFASDDVFMESLANWVGNSSGENPKDVYAMLKNSFETDQLATLNDILEADANG